MGYAKTRTGGREPMSLDVLKELFQRHFHVAPTHIQPLQGELGGSGRKIIRLANDRVSAVGVLHNGREENVAFLEFSKHFRRHLLPDFLLEAPRDYFLYRDFQSRNIMLRDGLPYFVDYQGGRKGALQYDIASLLFDAKADLPPDLRQRLLDHYLNALSTFIGLDREAFLRYYYGFVYVRIMQALGAYGYRGFFERKVHFLQSVPYALKNIRWLLHNVQLPIALPTLLGAFQSMLASEKLQSIAFEADNLVVRIFSFSFHHELPKDEAGNGGGFVFDGRGLPNPGREERFKSLTGQDPPVIDYLNQPEPVHQYLASVFTLIDATVDNFQHRGFKNLMVSFGCTGGQHRSVYLAEQLAKHLRGRSGVEVGIRHLELEKLGMLHAVVGNLAK